MTEPLTSDERAGLRAWAVADRDTTPWSATAIGTQILRLLDDLERVESERDAHMANRCRHGWRGATAEQITTPCPACGTRGLFIGAGGHLTCGNLGEGGNRGEPYSGCRDPSVEEFVVRLKADLERVERERDEAMRDPRVLHDRWLKCGAVEAETTDG